MSNINSVYKTSTNQQFSYFRAFLMASQQVLLVALIFFPSLASAASPVEQLETDITLSDSGAAKISHSLTYRAPSNLNWAVFSKMANLAVTADGLALDKSAIKTKRKSDKINIASTVAAKTWSISYESSGNLIRHNDRDQLFLKIFDKPAAPIFSSIITFKLPETTKQETNLAGNIYSLSGVTEPETKITDPRSLTFSAGFAGERSLLTVNSTWDKDVLALSSFSQARLSLNQLDVAPWLVFGLLLPISSLLVLLHILRRQKNQEGETEKVLTKPPSNLSAILVGVLVRKKIYPEQISALIINLCQRGYFIIVKKSDSYFIAKRKELDENVESWEKAIVSEMFEKQRTSSNDLQSLSNHNLYSPNVRKAFLRIYSIITDQSYFKENPHITRVKNKLLALAIYYISAVAIVWIAISASSPYLILPLVGAMIVAQIVLKLSVKLANYTKKGKKTRISWLSFNNYLLMNKPLAFEASRSQTFDKYLPYAVAMNSTLAWAKRFDLSNTVIIKPDWFVSYDEKTTVEFAKEISLFTSKIAQGITSLRGPLVS